MQLRLIKSIGYDNGGGKIQAWQRVKEVGWRKKGSTKVQKKATNQQKRIPSIATHTIQFPILFDSASRLGEQ